MAHLSPETKPVGWNGICFVIPEHWNLIVKGNCHLIIEQGLQPLLEFRWQNKAKAPSNKTQTDFILAQLHKETTKKPQLIKAPLFLEPAGFHFEVSAFSFDDNTHPAGAIITCRMCATSLLFQFFNTTNSVTEALISCFESFRCCPEDKVGSHWAIEDIAFKIPHLFTLDTYSSSLGLIRLCFKKKGINLRICRLTAAKKHLDRSSFTSLFTNFIGSTTAACTAIDDKTLLHAPIPSVGDHLLRVIKRKKIYRWSKFMHVSDRDKIMGIHMESSKPLDTSQIAFIEKNYEFVQ